MPGATKLLTSGGGAVTLQPASSIASDVVVQVPSVAGTLVNTGSTAQVSQAMLAAGVSGNGPAFSAYCNTAQVFNNAASTKVQCAVEEYDTANCFDNSTNYRFTPNVAGYYRVSGQVLWGASYLALVSIYKNGSEFKRGVFANGLSQTVSATIYLNGTTDYIEMYVYNSNGGSISTFSSGGYGDYFQAELVRAA